MHSLAGLLHVPFGVPALDYRDLLRVTRLLTRDERQVTEAYRRACFNVLAHNRDDHPRNIAFLMSASGRWALAPAFDLTPSHGPGGEHAMSVLGEGLPTKKTLARLGEEARVADAGHALKQVEHGLSRLAAVARRLGVPPPLAARLTRLLTA
ncbi:MAG: HipA domain-containing protein [Myxococcaceae bacterium]|nr:HipA domain-containing protein [Myxococcaceae bacterium]